MKLFRVYYQAIRFDNLGKAHCYEAYSDIWARSRTGAEYKFIMSNEYDSNMAIIKIIALN